jgi:hypothetical protein
MPWWWSLHWTRLCRPRISSLSRVPSRIHLLRTTWGFRTLLILICLISPWLKLVLFMEWVLAHLFILWVKSIEIMISLMPEIYHSTWTHSTVARVTGRALIDNIITLTILWYELLNISFTLSWLLLTSSRDTWEVITKHCSLTKAICLVVTTCLWPGIVET